MFNLCPGNAQGIADINSAMHLSAQIIISFLNGTSGWQSVGTAAESDPFLSVDGGLIIAAHAADIARHRPGARDRDDAISRQQARTRGRAMRSERLQEAGALLEADPPPHSDAWLELGERLEQRGFGLPEPAVARLEGLGYRHRNAGQNPSQRLRRRSRRRHRPRRRLEARSGMARRIRRERRNRRHPRIGK